MPRFSDIFRSQTLLHTIIVWFILVITIAPPAAATEKPELVPNQTDIAEALGASVDLSLRFQDDSGKEVALRDLYPTDRPAILVPMYFGCPRLCKLTSAGVAALINKLDLKIGPDYDVIAVSFDHTETPKLANERAQVYRAMLNGGKDPNGWHFLTGSEENVKAVMSQIGFRFKRDGEEFSHTTIFVVLSPTGVISRYFYGIDFPDKDVRFALVEAAAGRIGTTIDKILLYCFRFDPTRGKYTLVAINVMNIACLSVLSMLVVGLVTLKIREK